ncbi:MAG: amino acid permease [Tannerella sp.]|jgi:APA family basic amino acid/polyamine antiporter|nr:amino acid permease [Tannerella sp.]
MNNLFRVKGIDAIIAESHSGNKLKRSLSTGNLVALGIGAVIGTGIFVLTGTAAANYAGPALTLSFVISAIGCIMAGLCYAEFAAMIPVAGSAYSYSYATLGEFIAWLIGWDLILEYLFAASTVSVGWSGYMVSFLADWGLQLPSALTSAPFDYVHGQGWVFTGHLLNLPAMFVIALFSLLLLGGIRRSAILNNIIVVTKIIVILLFIIFGISYIDTGNYTPFIPENTGSFGFFGWSGILRGAGVIFFAYIGFDAVSTAAQEARNPQKSMPIGILYSLLICMVLYILVTIVLTGMVNYKELNVPAPIAYAIDRAGEALFWLRPFIKVGAIAGLSSVILVLLLGQSRIFFIMSKDGLLPPLFSRINTRYGTPHYSTLFTGLSCCIIAGLLPINVLGELVSIGTLMAFVLVCTSIIVLRRTRPDVKRPFRTPLVPFVPLLGILICLGQMLALPLDTWMRLFSWMAVGLICYFLYGRKHSLLNKQDSEQVMKKE